MIVALVFISLCLIVMGYITYGIIKEDRKINESRKTTKKSKKGKKWQYMNYIN